MKTAVEWLIEKLELDMYQDLDDNTIKIIEQAKAMEKQHIIEFGYDVADYLACGVFTEGDIEDRYNEFLKSE